MIKIIEKIFAQSDLDRLTLENRLLRENQFRQIEYIRRKANQMLILLGTLPFRPDELSEEALIAEDPIGVVADSFIQVLEHEKHLNEQLLAAHEEIHAILASVGVGIIVLDSNMKIQMHNQRVIEMFGFEKSDLNGKKCCQAVCNSDTYPPDCAFERVMATRRPVYQSDWVIKGKHFEVSAIPVKNRFGEVTKVVLAYTDITRRLETEMRLREREQIYLDVFENAGDIVQCVTPDGSFMYVNKSWRDTLGYSDEDVEGLKIWNIIAPECRSVCLDHFNSLMKGNKLSDIETTFFSKNNEELPVRGNVTISYSKDGRPLATFGMFRVVDKDKAE